VLKYYTTKVNKSIIDGFKQQVSEDTVRTYCNIMFIVYYYVLYFTFNNISYHSITFTPGSIDIYI